MREFERPQGEFGHFLTVFVCLVELESQPSLLVAHPGLAFEELVGVDLTGHPHVGEAVLLVGEQVELPGRLRDHRLRFLSVLQGLGAEGLREEFANRRVFNAEAVEHRQHLRVEVGLGHAVLRVPFGPPVLRTPVVAVLLLALLFDDLLAEDAAAAVPAPDQAVAVGEVQNRLRLVAQHGLHAVPRLPVDERLVLAGEPLVVELDLADVAPVLEQAVQVAEVPPRLLLGEREALLLEFLAHTFEAQVRVGVQLEQAADFLGGLRVGFVYVPPLAPHEVVAVVGAAVRQAVLRAAGLPLLDVIRHLIRLVGVEARLHHPVQPTGGVVLESLIDHEELDLEFAFEKCEGDVILQVATGSVEFGEHDADQFMGVGAGERNHLVERRALRRAGGGFRDPPESDEFAALPLDVPPDFLLLGFEGEPLAFLLAAGDAGQADVLLLAAPALGDRRLRGVLVAGHG